MSTDKTAQPHTVTVELDIYSGRPNPQWMLTVPETEYLLNALSTAAPRATNRAFAMPLGYRGFLISMRRNSGTQILRIANGVIEMTGHNGTAQFDDNNRTLERWLLESAVPHIDAELLTTVRNQH